MMNGKAVVANGVTKHESMDVKHKKSKRKQGKSAKVNKAQKGKKDSRRM